MVTLYTDDRMLDHHPPSRHPESPERLKAILRHLDRTGLRAKLGKGLVREATRVELTRVHHASYLDRLATFELKGGGLYEADTWVYPGSTQAALLAAGSCVEAVNRVATGPAEDRRAVCLVRPPGHHARPDDAMGFCLYGSVAAAAADATRRLGMSRVMIVDFDVHHGNGTEDIIAGDERVLMASIFQHPLYPYTGAVPMGTNMVNVPVPPYTRGPQIRALIEENWLERLDEFAPQMVFVSAGFDAHREDELGQLGLVESDYTWITEQIVALADRHAGGRIVSCLEGGYNLSALARSVAAHLRVLARV